MHILLIYIFKISNETVLRHKGPTDFESTLVQGMTVTSSNGDQVL